MSDRMVSQEFNPARSFGWLRFVTPVSMLRLILVLGVGILLFAPTIFSSNSLQVLTQFLCLVTLALMWNLLAGYTDIISLGQHLFVGTGAYAFFGMVSLVGVNPFLAIPLAGLIGMISAKPIMAVVFRLRAA